MSEDIGVLRGRVQIDIDATIANLRKLHRAMRVASNEIGKSTSKVVAASKALDGHGKKVKNVGDNTDDTRKKTALWQVQMQNLTKSVQLALGPLSGVAARITALTALFNRNTIILAGVIGGITGLSVASGKAITAGRAFEQQMMRIEGILTVMGPSAKFTADELNEMAQSLGESTLASAGGMRDAAAALLQFRNISKDTFQPILEAAQGLTATIGGNLIRNVRRLGRAFEDPAENLESLERSGISFTQTQEDMIEVMLNTGRVAEANALILSEMETQIAAATSEAGGLSGAIDTLGERVNRFFENAATGSGLISNLTESINQASGAMNELLNNGTSAKAFGDTLAVAVDGAVAVFEFLIKNIQAVATTLTAVFAGAVAKTIVGGIVGMTKNIGRLAVSMNVLSASALRASRTMKALAIASRLLPFVAAGVAIWATVEALMSYTQEGDGAAESTKALAERLSEAETEFDNMGTAAREAASAQVTALAREIEMTDKRIESLKEQERLLKPTENRISGAAPGQDASEEEKKRLEEVRSERMALEKQRVRAIENVQRYKDAVEDAAQTEQELGDIPEFFKEMRKEFQPHIADMREYRVRLESAQEIMDKFDRGAFGEDTLEEMRKIGLTAESFRDILVAIRNSEPSPKGLDKARDAFSDLQEDVTKYANAVMGIDYDAQSVEARKLTDNLEDHPEAARAHAMELGILNSQMMTHDEVIAAIQKKYLAWIKNRDHLENQDTFQTMQRDLERQVEATKEGENALLAYNTRKQLANDQGKDFAKVSDEQVASLVELERRLTQIESDKAFNELTQDLMRQAEALGQGEEAFKRYEAQTEIASTRGIKFSKVTQEEVDQLRKAQKAVEDATRTKAFDDMNKDLDRQMKALRGGNDALQEYNDLTEIASTLGVKFSEVTDEEADALLEKLEALRKIEQQNAFDDLTDDMNRQILALKQGDTAFERYTAQMELASKQGIEFSEVNQGQLDIFIAQKEAIEDLEAQAERMQEAYDGAGQAIGSTLDEILGESVRLGQSLSDTFKDATGEALTFGNVLEQVGRKLADVILQTQVIDPLEQGVTDFVKNMFTTNNNSGYVDDGTRGPSTGHTGGIVGNLKKYHSGGIVGGLKNNEEVSVLEKGEGVFTEDQMAAMGRGGSNVEIIFIDQRSNSDPAPEVQEGTGPDGRRQIKIWLKDAIREASGDGTMDSGMGSRYGIRPQTSRRRS